MSSTTPDTTAAVSTGSVRPAKPENALRLASVNVNGIRAAYRKGMADWLADREVDILCLQEVRAPDDVVNGFLAEEWHLLHAEAADKGRAGVLIASRKGAFEPTATRLGVGDSYFDTTGRWVEADYALPGGKQLTVVSAYVHSGEVDTPKQVDKYRFLDAMVVRLPELAAHSDYAVIVGDLNVGHKTLDIKNWKGNVKNAGFLPQERAYFDRFFGEEIGWKDVAREIAGEVEGPYTWWSQRGQAFDNNTGWRIDYQMVTPSLLAEVADVVVDRAASYDGRWSDHAPLVVDYTIL
ncbi:exodeoxyribonuclease III [Psychromicrobium xiongbiense]|uniref:exodeoxyribonuclease III n=1 Tax=Psychromicrobium xiongbiense TaxID=3051184 RepID=UPI002553B808|nr:exodeoxyribonuclease III [Psychromicrobium sp. YIM S02556]